MRASDRTTTEAPADGIRFFSSAVAAASSAAVKNRLFLVEPYPCVKREKTEVPSMSGTTNYVKPAPYKGFAIGSAIFAACILILYILQQMGVIPMSPF
jgi:hypothetical protein